MQEKQNVSSNTVSTTDPEEPTVYLVTDKRTVSIKGG
jgi:hypothetical protein